MFSVRYLKECFEYRPTSGLIFWKERPLHHFTNEAAHKSFNAQFAGRRAFTSFAGNGYEMTTHRGVTLYAHRVAFAIMTGRHPTHDIDHRNRHTADNRWTNLREASRTMNLGNMVAHRDNRTGMKGVTWNRQTRKFQVRIRFRGKQVSIGYFNTPEAAAQAYRKEATKRFGRFARFQ